MYPSQDIIGLSDPQEKKRKIIQELLEKKPTIRSIHGVPNWSFAVIDELMKRDSDTARKILKKLEYVSI